MFADPSKLVNHTENVDKDVCVTFCGWQSIEQDAGVGYETQYCKDCKASYESTYNPEKAKLLGLDPKPDIDTLYDDPRYAQMLDY